MKHQTQEQGESFEGFIKLESVQELLLNLQGSKHKNSKPKSKTGLYSSQMVYANRLPSTTLYEILPRSSNIGFIP